MLFLFLFIFQHLLGEISIEELDEGAKVKAGTPLLKVDLEAIRAAGHPTATALIVTNSDDLPEISVVADGDAAAGAPVFKFKK